MSSEEGFRIPDSQFGRSLVTPPAGSSSSTTTTSSTISNTISTLNLLPHIEGGFYAETDRDQLLVPNPFQNLPLLANATSKDTSTTRHASTTIYYLITPTSPVGYFHRNRGRTIHTLHKGRARYVIIHADRRDSATGKAPVETFVVGHDIAKGERLQWIVEGGKYKASFLLPDVEGGDQSHDGALISETVVPGFEFSDHDFLTADGFEDLVGGREDVRGEVLWLLKKAEQEKLARG